jgi:hypothetical protein
MPDFPIAPGSRVLVQGRAGTVTGVVGDVDVVVALDQGEVVLCDLADVEPAQADEAVRIALAERQANLLVASRTCLQSIVETIGALAGEEEIGLVLLVCVGEDALRTKGAVVVANIEATVVRPTMADTLAAAERIDDGDPPDWWDVRPDGSARP